MTASKRSVSITRVNNAITDVCRAKGCIEDFLDVGDGNLRQAIGLLERAQKILEEQLDPCHQPIP